MTIQLVGYTSKARYPLRMLQLTRENKNPTIDDTKRVTKSEQKVMILKKEDNLADSKLLVFCDASFANMTVGGSQGGYIVF